MTQCSSDCRDQQTYLNNKKVLSRDVTQPESNKSINIYNIKKYKVPNIFKRYGFTSIFDQREKNFKIKKLNLKVRNNSFSIRKSDNSTSQNSIYITQNPSLGDYSQLPLIYEKIENDNNEKMKKVINIKKRFNTKIRNIINNSIKEKDESQINQRNNNNILMHKIKTDLNRAEERNVNKSANYIKNKRLYELTGFKTLENSKRNYMDKLHEFINKKMLCNFKKERIVRIEEIKYTELQAIKDKIYSLKKSQNLMDNNYLIKCKEYIFKLYRIIENLENQDNIFYTKVIALDKEIKAIEKKISEVLDEKKIYVKWMFFQIQVKEKALKTPKKYEKYLEANLKLPNELEKYKKDIIYPTPEDLIYQFESHKNNNINLMKICQKVIRENSNLKKVLNKEIKTSEYLSKKDEEVKKLIQRRDKVKNRYQILTDKLNSLYEKLYVFSGSKKKEKVSEIYLKLTKMKINCLKKKEIEPLFKTKETEMLYILKELESTYYYERDKHKYYLKNNKDDIKIVLMKRFTEKRFERVLDNKRKLNEKKLLENNRMIKKYNKKILLPTIKVNWDLYKMNKRTKSVININNSINEEEDVEKNFEFMQYD